MIRIVLSLFVLFVVTCYGLDKVSLDGYKNALCLDGSKPTLYLGRGKQSKKFVFHFEGGAWCNSWDACLKRSQGHLGSSRGLPASLRKGGYLSQDPKENPEFHDFNLVFLRYCDGTFFAGELDNPVSVHGKHIHVRGKSNLDAMLDWLSKNAGLKSATEVIVSGGSAGGIATFLHSGYIADYLSGVKVLSAPDAGFLPINQNSNVAKSLTWLVSSMGMKGTSDYFKQCLTKTSKDKLWQCVSGDYIYPHMKMPTFISNSVLDSWQLPNIAGMDKQCIANPTKCMDQMHKWQKYFTDRLKSAMDSNPNSRTTNGGFNPACVQHEQLQNGGIWTRQKVDGYTLRDVFASWYHNDKKAPRWSVDVQFPNNPTCRS